jgi:hypothetical protein
MTFMCRQQDEARVVRGKTFGQTIAYFLLDIITPSVHKLLDICSPQNISYSGGDAPYACWCITRLWLAKANAPFPHLWGSHITPADWEARERPRQLLENIMTRQAGTYGEQRKAIRKESLKGPSPYERAAETAPTHPNARLSRRMQDSNFREVRKVTGLLLKIKRQSRED